MARAMTLSKTKNAMSQELIYTSSQLGLKPGSRGFCTVAATAGLAPQKLALLESLSGYRHTQSPTGAAHPGNPIVFSHLILPSRESLLSRIADAGLDYSGRTNKIAHHILIEGSEQPFAGPASILAASGSMISTWTGDPRMLAQRNLPTGSLPQGPCTEWKRITGDAGWAGALAQSAASGTATDAYIVFESNMDCLPLIEEALSLLQPADRWRVTFSTFFTSLPPNIPCQWKCVLKGSKEHQAIPPHNRVLKLDLTSSLGRAPDSPLVEAARTGVRIAPEPVVIKPASVSEALISKRRGLHQDEERPLPAIDEYQLQASPLRPNTARGFQQSPSVFNDLPLSSPPTPVGRKRKEKTSLLPYLITSLIAFLLGGVISGGGTFIVLEKKQSTELKNQKSELKKQKDKVQELKNKLEQASNEKKPIEDALANLKKTPDEKQVDIEFKAEEIKRLQTELKTEKNNLAAKQSETDRIQRELDAAKNNILVMTNKSKEAEEAAIQTKPNKKTAQSPNATKPTKVTFVDFGKQKDKDKSTIALPANAKLTKAEFWNIDSNKSVFNKKPKITLNIEPGEASSIVKKNNEVGLPGTKLFTYENNTLIVENTFVDNLGEQFLFLEFDDKQSYLLRQLSDKTQVKPLNDGVINLEAPDFDNRILKGASLSVAPEENKAGASWELIQDPAAADAGKTEVTKSFQLNAKLDKYEPQPVNNNLVAKYMKRTLKLKLNKLDKRFVIQPTLISVDLKTEELVDKAWEEISKFLTVSVLASLHRDKKIHVSIKGAKSTSPDNKEIELQFDFDLVLDLPLPEEENNEVADGKQKNSRPRSNKPK